MDILSALAETIAANWPAWLVTLTLIVAAVIDGFELKVPNWITFPLAISGWIYCTIAFGLPGLGWSLLGTAVGLALLLPAYAIGGMGAGDVKLLAGVGAWMYAMLQFAQLELNAAVAMAHAFAISATVGALLAVGMVAVRKGWKKHSTQFRLILAEIITIRRPAELAEIAAERKSSMLLLPYGIPIAIGTIGYFVWMGMLV